MANLYIPKKIKVGFQNRQGTFTGKLAYVIYFDDKNILRKEMSWQNWRDCKIDPIEFDNEPRAGFLFNKGVQRYGYHWGSGRSSIRVYDPRDFEFEVTVDNLIGILMHSDVSKRDIVEECIYAWDGKDLVLLPVNSDQYQASLKYTEKQAKNVTTKDLVKGYTYTKKKNDEILTYIGHYRWYDWAYARDSGYSTRVHKAVGKKHVFHDGKNFVTPTVATLSSVVSEEVAENYATLVEDFFKTQNSQRIVSIKLLPEKSENSFYKIEDNKIQRFNLASYEVTDYQTKEISAYARKNASFFSDRYLNEYIFEFHEKETKQFDRRDWRYTGYWNDYRPTAFQQKLIDKSIELGYDLATIKLADCAKVIETENFKHGQIAYVLENGAECSTNL